VEVGSHSNSDVEDEDEKEKQKPRRIITLPGKHAWVDLITRCIEKQSYQMLKRRFHCRANPSCSSSLTTFERHVQLAR
jgi:hypothetical protein